MEKYQSSVHMLVVVICIIVGASNAQIGGAIIGFAVGLFLGYPLSFFLTDEALIGAIVSLLIIVLFFGGLIVLGISFL